MQRNSEPAPNRTAASIAKSVLRTAFDGGVAFVFFVVAAETYAHRLFEPDPRYQLFMTTYAILIFWLGLLPLLFHFAPRVGKLAFLAWLGYLLLLVIAGVVTRPEAGGRSRPEADLER